MQVPAVCYRVQHWHCRVERRHVMRFHRLLYAVILTLPVVGLYVHHYAAAPDGQVATGFIQYDMPYYVANGRQYFDGGSSGLFYSNPYIYNDDNPSIYLHPHIYLFGLVATRTLERPGMPFVLFGILFTIPAFYILIRLVADLLPHASLWQQRFLVLIVAWGGGLLSAAGTLKSLATGMPIRPLQLDPSDGWWFLNLGRNFIFPTEALYHLLVLLFLWMVLRGKHWSALATALILAFCHPYTGIQYGIILAIWVMIELLFVRSGLFRFRTAWLFALPLVYCVAMNLHLMMYPTHRALVAQWALDWGYKLESIAPAYLLVFGLFVLQCSTPQRFSAHMARPFNRLLLIAAFLSFAMANHEAFFSPHQPIHFTRGHIWLPLCLLGLPYLLQAWGWIKTRSALKIVGPSLFAVVMLTDNAVFFATQMRGPLGMYTTPDQLDLFGVLRDAEGAPIIMSDNSEFAYLSTVYSQARPYYGHYFNTLDAATKRDNVEQFFESATIPEELIDSPLLVVTFEHTELLQADERFERVYTINDAGIFRYKRDSNR